MLFSAWVVFHVLVCVALVLVVLMQSAKGEGLAGGTAFGGGLSGAVFGGRGAASFLSKATTVLAILFMFNCGALAFMSSQTRKVATTSEGQPTEQVESAVTRRAQQERDAAMAAQAAEAQAKSQDSAAQQPAPATGQPQTQPTPAGTGN